MKVANVMDFFDGRHANFIGGSDCVSGVTAAAGQPDGHSVWVVISSVCHTSSNTIVWRSPKLTTPNNKRTIKKVPRL